MSHLLTLPFVLVLLAACHSRSAPTSPPVSKLVQWTGQQGGETTSNTRVLRTASEWNAFWKQAGRDRPRPMDATQEMAVVISLGERRTGGFGAEVLHTGVQEGKLVIDYRETAPAPGMMVTQALTYPWVVVLIPRSDLPVLGRSMKVETQSLREK